MKVYLDTSVIVLSLFGAKGDPDRIAEVAGLFQAIDDGHLQATISLYGLQELCVFCYDNFPSDQAAQVARLAFHDILGHDLLLVPLLNRAQRIVLNRRFPMSDASDQAHAATAFHHGCEVVVTYDSHYQAITHLLPCLTAAELLERLGERKR
ncbi:MAG: PIN domain-containing protein [Caldilineales bacterium]|nr:PIN domain-containing protein [Caldilineales bacterium]MCW5857393.1 PIN domain-containing protein [Caldilineales bacterium]